VSALHEAGTPFSLIPLDQEAKVSRPQASALVCTKAYFVYKVFPSWLLELSFPTGLSMSKGGVLHGMPLVSVPHLPFGSPRPD